MNIAQSRREAYVLSLPERPYCTNRVGSRLLIRDRQMASGYSMIQHNSPLVLRWMVFDIDSSDAFFRYEECGLPAPTFIALNPANGHGHLAYQLESPVFFFTSAGNKSGQFLVDVERGMTRRLGADRAYPGFLSKNPLSSKWLTQWMALRPYQLSTLNDYLDPADKRRIKSERGSGCGRNFTLFETLRKDGYHLWHAYNKAGRVQGEFERMLFTVAEQINITFCPPLTHSEIRSIVRSVAKWIWANFSMARFSAIQSARSLKRWSKNPTLTAMKPWAELVISRRTWERRRKAGTLP